MSEPYRPVDTQCILHGCQTTVLRAEIEQLRSTLNAAEAIGSVKIERLEAENARLTARAVLAEDDLKRHDVLMRAEIERLQEIRNSLVLQVDQKSKEIERLEIENKADIAELESKISNLRAKNAAQNTENARLKTALAFARSVIKSGEKWSDECERLLNASAN